MEKAIIIGVITNLGSLIVLFWLLGRIQRLMQEHPSHDQSHDQEEETKDDDSWHSWRFWLPPEDEPTEKGKEIGDKDRPDHLHGAIDQTKQGRKNIKTETNEEIKPLSNQDGQVPPT